MKKIMFNDRYGLTQAVLDGRKTMTRRIMKPQPEKIRSIAQDIANNPGYEISYQRICPVPCHHFLMNDNSFIYPTYRIGEIVAVAQSYDSFYDDGCNPTLFPDGAGWTNKMFVRADMMPHQIRITSVRAERLQDISYEDCLREGVGISATDNLIGFPIAIPFNYYIGRDEKGYRYVTPREAFASLINGTSGRGTWQSNPWVWVYEFELVK